MHKQLKRRKRVEPNDDPILRPPAPPPILPLDDRQTSRLLPRHPLCLPNPIHSARMRGLGEEEDAEKRSDDSHREEKPLHRTPARAERFGVLGQDACEIGVSERSWGKERRETDLRRLGRERDQRGSSSRIPPLRCLALPSCRGRRWFLLRRRGQRTIRHLQKAFCVSCVRTKKGGSDEP